MLEIGIAVRSRFIVEDNAEEALLEVLDIGLIGEVEVAAALLGEFPGGPELAWAVLAPVCLAFAQLPLVAQYFFEFGECEVGGQPADFELQAGGRCFGGSCARLFDMSVCKPLRVAIYLLQR